MKVHSSLDSFVRVGKSASTKMKRGVSVEAVWKNRNLQLYFGGQIVSLIGTWMQQVALSWLVYKLTSSPFMLGLIGFSSEAPSLLLAPFAGVIADRANRHHLILITQALSMVQAAFLAALVLTGHSHLWQLVTLSAWLGVITAFDLTARQSFLVDMLEDERQLPSVIATNSSINTLTRLVGPFVAGLLVAWAGEGTCFLVNALSYIAVILALLFVRAKQRTMRSSTMGALAQFCEGFVYTIRFTPIRDLILFIAVMGVFAMPFAILMPAFAKDVFRGNAITLGLLTGASGAGSVMGALFLATRKGIEELSRWIILSSIICGLALIVFGGSILLPLSLLAVTAAGFGGMIMLAGSNTLIQTIVDEDKRGRVMSFVVMAFKGIGPCGCLAAGALANVIGVGRTVAATGILTLALSFIFGARIMRIHLKVNPIRINQGIREADSEKNLVNK